MEIIVDDLSGNEVIDLLKEHLEDMYKASPPESAHALNIPALKSPAITFFSGWQGKSLMGCVAIKKLNHKDVELKSMRTVHSFRGQGVASKLLNHALKTAVQENFETMYLETGTPDYFEAARNVYAKFGFVSCDPFDDYVLDPYSCFMKFDLKTFSNFCL